MTNDLNNTPAIVRDGVDIIHVALDAAKLFAIKYPADFVSYRLIQAIDDARAFLCQPNIVIVDLDDTGTVERVADALLRCCCNYYGDEYPKRGVGELERVLAKAALAALKEKTND